MARVGFLVVLGVLTLPSPCTAQQALLARAPLAEPQLVRPQWPPRQIVPPPLPPGRYPMGFRGPLTEHEWARWLLRSKDQLSQCRTISIVSGALAAGGLATALKHPRNPSPEDLLAGRTGKRSTFLDTWGTATLVVGGITFLSTARCATLYQATVWELEQEGRRRGFGPPTGAPLDEREWITRIAWAKSAAGFGRWLTIAGTTAMALGGLAMYDHEPMPDRRGAGRLGPGIGFFLAGFGSAVAGSVAWARNAREVADLTRTPPKSAVAFQVAPQRRGLRAGVVVSF